MPHDISLISTLAVGFGLALLLGYLATFLRMPPLVGYLLAGIMIGPATPGFVADVGLSSQLAEIGVMLLMFGVGLHFSMDDLLAVKKIAVPGALFQIIAATLMGTALGLSWGWAWGSALVFGVCLSVASTVVLLKALESKGQLETGNGQIAIGWLVVEDLVMVLVLVLLPAMAPLLGGTAIDPGGEALHITLLKTLAKVVAFIVFMLIVGKRVFPRILWWVEKTGSRELFTLCVIACAIGVAFGSAKLFDVSFALGAFFAGMMMRESEYSHRAADESLPLRDAFSVLFFVSVGMLFDPRVLLDSPIHVLATVGIVVLGKTLAAIGLVLLFRYPLNTALTVGISLAQIGEFSFILATLGKTLGLMDDHAHNLVLAAALVSIALNSFLFSLAEPLRQWVLRHSATARSLDNRPDPLATLPYSTPTEQLRRQTIVVGYGQVGQYICEQLAQAQAPLVIVDQTREKVDQLRKSGFSAVVGDASDPATLIQAHIVHAAHLVIAIPDTIDVHKMVDIARTLNPDVRVLIRSADAQTREWLRKEEMGIVFDSKTALAQAMAQHLLTPDYDPKQGAVSTP